MPRYLILLIILATTVVSKRSSADDFEFKFPPPPAEVTEKEREEITTCSSWISQTFYVRKIRKSMFTLLLYELCERETRCQLFAKAVNACPAKWDKTVVRVLNNYLTLRPELKFGLLSRLAQGAQRGMNCPNC